MDKKNTKKIHKLAVFIFRRDLRIEDNTALFHALRLCEQVVPIFIFDNNQINPEVNSYFSHNLVQFMIESLKDLNNQLKEKGSRLFFFHGEVEATFEQMLDEIKPDALFINEDVTPYAIKRDNRFEDICVERNIKLYHHPDYMLVAKDKVLLTGGRFYQKFTPYFNAASAFPVARPEPNIFDNYISVKVSYASEYSYKDLDKFYKRNPNLEVNGGRKEALKILQDFKKFKNYQNTRNYPALPTTRLSAYNKFGCVSIREVYHAAKEEFGASCTFIQQLYWRDFYYNIAYYYPHVFGNPMKEKYEGIKFENDPELFEKWKNGMTGCPIVDAAMRHLKKKGFVPNRLRMVVSNFLIKDLLIDWKLGEKHFAQNLVDYDPSQNSGGWQWAAGCGTDSQPYFRIFNPKLQSEKFDVDCNYILEWIPELKGVEKEHIHDWEEFYTLYKNKKINYPAPIIKHQVQKKKCLKMYKDCLYGEDNEGSEAENEEEEEKEKEVVEKKGKKVKAKVEKKAPAKKEDEKLTGKTDKKDQKKGNKKRKMDDEESEGQKSEDEEVKPKLKKTKKSEKAKKVVKKVVKKIKEVTKVEKESPEKPTGRTLRSASARKTRAF